MTESARALGEKFAASLAAKDRDGLVSLLADDIDFRAMTPRKFWEPASPAEIVDDVILGHWFEPSDDIRSLLAVDSEDVADRARVRYRLSVVNDDGEHLVEQQAYLDERDGQISWMRVMCSGYRPVAP